MDQAFNAEGIPKINILPSCLGPSPFFARIHIRIVHVDRAANAVADVLILGCYSRIREKRRAFTIFNCAQH